MANRNQKLIIIVGASGTGKTNYLRFYLSLYRTTGKKILILNPQNEPQFSRWGAKWLKDDNFFNADFSQYLATPEINIKNGKPKMESNQDLCNRLFSKVSYSFTKKRFNGLLVCDDATAYITEMYQNAIISNTINLRGQSNLDLIFVFHSITDVPPYILRKADRTIIFPVFGIDEKNSIEKSSQICMDYQHIINFVAEKGGKYIFAKVDNVKKTANFEKINITQSGDIDEQEPIIRYSKKDIIQKYNLAKKKNIPY